MKRDVIIGIDPGYTTGIAILDNVRRRDAPDLVDFNTLAAYEIDWNGRTFATRSLLETYAERVAAIVIEEFKLFPYIDAFESQIGSVMPSARVIGIIEAYADVYNIADRIVFAEVWQRKQVRTRTVDAPVSKRSRHTSDAYAHAYYYARTHHLEFER